MKIHAFQGFRFAGDAEAVGELAAPPFDQIDDELRGELHGRSSRHYSRFTRPVADGDDVYAAAAAVHRSWLESGAVVRDQRPSLYPYLIELADGGRRAGLCCLVEAGTPEESDLRPHEHTVAKPLADRLALLRATEIDPEPVMVVAEDDGSLERRLLRDVEGREPVAMHVDAGGHRHSLYRLSDPETIAGYRTLLEERSATIADGHHRSKTAQLYAREVGARAGTAPASKMAVLLSSASPSLEIAPIHRGVVATLDLDAVAGVAAERTVVEGVDGVAMARAVAEAPAPALGVRVHGRAPEIWRLDAEQAPPETPDPARDLPVVLLHYLVLARAGLALDSWTDGTILYRSDPGALWRAIDSGEIATGFFLPPMDADAFSRAVSEGDVLPPKSTRFLPKLVSGLVWCGHDAEVE